MNSRLVVFAFAICSLVALICSIASPSRAQVVAQYDFSGGDPNSIDIDATTSADPFMLGPFSNGSSSPGFSSSSGTAFVRTNATGGGSSNNTLADAISGDDYFSFTLDTLGNSKDLTSLTFDHLISSATASVSFDVSVMSSITGFTDPNDALASFNFSGVSGSVGPENRLVDLASFGTTFEGLTSTVEFRFYFYDNSTSNSRIHRIDNVILTAGIPQPESEWLTDGDGFWSTASNWSTDPNIPGTGGLTGNNVLLGAAITDDRTITLDTSAEVGTITISNANNYTIIDDPNNPGANSITLSGQATVQTNSGTHRIDAIIAGSDGLTKRGGGDLFISGNNTYTGPTDIQDGRLRIESLSSIDNTVGGTINIASTGEVTLQGDPNMSGNGVSGTIVPDITGVGTFTMSSSLTTETVTLDNAKSLGGLIDLNGGTLAISNSDALGVGDPNDASTRTRVTGQVFVNGVQVQSSAQLHLSGDITVASETLDLRARNEANETAHVSNISGDNTWNGRVELGNGEGYYTIDSADPNGSLTIGGDILDSDDESGEVVTLRLTGAGDGTISGNFIDQDADPNNGADDNANIAVIKQGAGTWTIGTASASSADYYQGNTTIEEGTLAVTASGGTNGELASPVIDIRAGASLDVTSFTDYSTQVGQTISGAGTIDAQTISYFGDDGTLSPGDNGVGTMTINVSGSFDMDTFTDSPAGALAFELSDDPNGANDLIVVNGAVTVDAASGSNKYNVNVSPAGAGFASSTYTLVDATTLSGGATGANFNVNLVDSQGNQLGATRQSFAVDVDTAADEIQLEVTGAAANLTWNGTVNSDWDAVDSNGTGGTANWTGAGDNRFFTLDNVTFSDGAANSSGNVTPVIVTETVVPGSMTFTNSADTYVFSGAAGISGGTAMTLNSGATVRLNNAGNDFTGDISIASGATLQIGDGDPNNTDPQVLSGSRNIINSGSLVQAKSSNAETYSGVISGSGSVTQNSTSGAMILTAQNTYTGATVVNDGTIRIGSLDPNGPNTQLGSTGTGTTVNAGGAVRANSQTGTVAEPLTLNGGELAVGGGSSSALTWSGPITIGAVAGSRIASDGGTGSDGLTISGNITGSSGQALNSNAGGGATINYTGTIGHDGSFDVSGGGTTALTGTASVSSPVISTADGANLDVTATNTGELSLSSSQTLEHLGEVIGNVVATSGSKISIGGTGGFNNTQVSFSLDSAADNRISWDPNSPDTDTPENPTFQLRVGINGSGAQPVRSAIQWNLSSVLSQFASITSVDAASIEVLDNTQAVDGTSGSGHTLELRELTVDFTSAEVTASESSSGVQWTGYDSTSATWAGAGDFGLLLASQTEVPGADTVNPIVFADSANMRTAVSNALSGSGNLNVILKISDAEEVSQLGNNSFFSFDDADDSTAPALNVTVTGGQLTGINRALITGDLSLDTGSVIEFDLGSTTQFDELEITGDFTVGGTFDVNLLGSFSPGAGDVFDLFDYDPNATITGSFDVLDLPVLSGGLTWNTSNLLTTGEISVVDDLPGDFNMDGRVDGADFLAWQRNPALGSLSDWEANYGLPTTSNTTSVPEPSAALLLLLGAAGVCSRRRR